jgi:hypothetical protein
MGKAAKIVDARHKAGHDGLNPGNLVPMVAAPLTLTIRQ